MFKVMEIIATFFYTGKLPLMPGTWASALASILIYLFWPRETVLQIAVTLFLLILSLVSSSFVAQALRSRDPECVVIDEVAGMAFSLLGLPARGNLSLVLGALFLFRVVDIMKPPPIPLVERLSGGAGITLDDVVAGLFVNAIVRLAGGF